MTIDLTNLLPHLPVWLLVLFRLTGLFVFAPLLGSIVIPARVRVFWAVALSLCIYPVLVGRADTLALIQPVLQGGLSLWMLLPVVALELLIGMVIGFGAGLPLAGVQIAGQIADQQIGTGLAGLINPDMGEDQAGVISQFYYLFAFALLLILGGHRVMIGAILNSYSTVPLGGFAPDGRMIELLVGLLSSMFELALRISAPLLCLVFLETVAMGFVARTVPQLNLMTIGFPLRIMAGVGILVASLSSDASVLVRAIQGSLRSILGFFA